MVLVPFSRQTCQATERQIRPERGPLLAIQDTVKTPGTEAELLSLFRTAYEMFQWTRLFQRTHLFQHLFQWTHLFQWIRLFQWTHVFQWTSFPADSSFPVDSSIPGGHAVYWKMTLGLVRKPADGRIDNRREPKLTIGLRHADVHHHWLRHSDQPGDIG